MFRLFHVDKTLKSYTFPIVKAVSALSLLILLLFFRFTFGYHNNAVIDVLVGGLCVVLVMCCLLCITVAFAEAIIVSEHRTKVRLEQTDAIKQCKPYSMEEILSLVKEDPIIEIQIVSRRKIIEIGSSSDMNLRNRHFFNKLYYVEDKTFSSIDEFEKAIYPFSNYEKISVLAIDGILCKKRNQWD